MPNAYGEPTRDELPIGTNHRHLMTEMLRLRSDHAEDLRRHGLRAVADDLVARGIITTRLELDTFEALARP
jgi:hypothetical protein